MKILMLNYEFPPIGGGAGHCTHYLAETLSQQGVKIDVLTSRYGNLDQKCENLGVRVFQVPILRKGVHDCGIRGAMSYLFLAGLKIRSLVRENQYDLIHCFFCVPTGLLFYLLKDFKQIPTIVSLRGSDVPNYDPYNQRLKIFHFILRPFSLAITQMATKVVANSYFLRDLAVRHLKRPDITSIPNGVNIEFFKPKAKNRNGNNPVQLVCVSRLLKRKGIEDLVKAMINFEDTNVCLNIIGSGSSERDLKNLIEEKNLSHKVKLLGFIPQENLPNYYNSADIFVLPSLTESGGEAFMEAMSCGLPVVSTTAGGIPEYVSNGDNGLLVSSGDPDGLHKALRKIIYDNQLRESMGRKGREIVMTNHSWERVTEQYYKIYRELASP